MHRSFQIRIPVLLVCSIAAVTLYLVTGAAAPAQDWAGRVSLDLKRVYTSATVPTGSASSKHTGPQVVPGARFDALGRVQVDVHVDCAASPSTKTLAQAGLIVDTSVKVPPFCVVEGWVSPQSVPALAAVAGVTLVRLPVYRLRRHQPASPKRSSSLSAKSTFNSLIAGTSGPAIDGNGVSIMHADQFVSATSTSGSGVTIGVISDDVTSAAVIQARGELPTSIPNYSSSTNPSPTDEGTMMLEEVHAVAPGASLAFCGVQTEAEYVSCLQSFFSNGVTIAVDDVAFTDDAMSADAPLTQAVQQLLSQNASVALFSSVGNDAGSYWEGSYVPSPLSGSITCTANGQIDNYAQLFAGVFNDPMTLFGRLDNPILLQWADPSNGNISNFDLYILDQNFNLLSCIPGTGSSDPADIVLDPALAAGTYHLAVATPDQSFAGKFLKLEVLGDGISTLSVSTSGSVLSPHKYAVGVATIGAVNGGDGIGNSIEGYSSTGPVNLIFPTPTQVQAPVLVAPDNIYVDVTGTTFASEAPTGMFQGTSAAAPNAAAVAALIRSAFPSLTRPQLFTALQTGAAQLGSPVPDGTFGYGRVDAMGALGSLPFPTMTGFPNMTIVGGTSSPPAAFTVGGVGNLRFSVHSSDATLIPALLSATGSPGVTVAPASCGAPTVSCTIVVTPAIGKTGSSQITLVDIDGANRTASITSTMTVVKPAAPSVTVTGGGTQSITEGGTGTAVTFVIAGTGPLTVSIASSNTSLLPVSAIALTGAGCGPTVNQASCVAKLSPTSGQSGTAVVTITVHDPYGQSGNGTATLEISAPPSSGSGGGGGGALDELSLLLISGLLFMRDRRQGPKCASLEG